MQICGKKIVTNRSARTNAIIRINMRQTDATVVKRNNESKLLFISLIYSFKLEKILMHFEWPINTGASSFDKQLLHKLKKTCVK